MDRAAAIERVTLLGAVTARPVIDPTQVAAIVDAHRIPDVNGARVNDTGWEPSYDVNAATAEVYRVKAGLVSGDFNFTADDLTASKGDVLANLLGMEAFYSARSGSASGTGTGGAGTMDLSRGAYLSDDDLAARLIP